MVSDATLVCIIAVFQSANQKMCQNGRVDFSIRETDSHATRHPEGIICERITLTIKHGNQ